MKYPKALGLAVAAALAFAAFAGAGPASATVLCKEEKTPCGAADYPAGTEFKAQLVNGVSDLWKAGEKVINTCTASTITGKTTTTGGATSTVTLPLSSLTWGGCTTARKALKPGTFEIHYRGAELNPDATVTSIGMEWEEAGCTYGTGAGAVLGGFTKTKPGSHTILDVQITVPKLAGGFLCPITVKWEATYTITAPTPLYVRES
jgi:hypothetical protein